MYRSLFMKFLVIVVATCLCLIIVWKFEIIDLIRYSGSFKTWEYPKKTGFISFSQSGRLFLTFDRTVSLKKSIKVKIRKLSTGEVIQTLPNIFSWRIVFSPDDSLIASANEKGQIQIWRISVGELIHFFQSHEDSKMRTGFVGLTPDGKTLVTKAGKTNYLSTVSTPYYASQINIWNLENETKRYTILGSYNRVNISPDGKLLAACSKNEPLALYQLGDGTLIRQFEETSKSCSQPQFSPDGKLLAISSKIYNVENGKLEYTLRAKTGFFRAKESLKSVVFSPNSQYSATSYRVNSSSSSDFFVAWGHSYPLTSHGRIRLWRMEDGKQLQTLRGHRKGSSALVFSPDGKFLASTGADSKVRFWKMPPRNYSWLWLLGTAGLTVLICWRRNVLINWIGR